MHVCQILLCKYNVYMQQKTCKKCGETKDVTLFSKSKTGYTSPCKECKRLASKKYHEEHREYFSLKTKQWRKENTEYNAARCKKWLKENEDHIKEWRVEYSKKYRSVNKDKIYSYVRKYRNVKLNAQGQHSENEWMRLVRLYNNLCLACGKTNIVLTRDHIIPLSKGGSDYIWNIQPLCQSCNSKKHVKKIDYRPKWIDNLNA